MSNPARDKLRERNLVPTAPEKISFKKKLAFILAGLAAAFGIRKLVHLFLFFPIIIQSDFNAPELAPNTRVYINRWIAPKAMNRGDFILFTHPNNSNLTPIRRIYGSSGDSIEIRSGKIFINDAYFASKFEEGLLKKFPESITTIPESIYPLANMEKRIIPPNHYFVLADNPENALDSREFGPVPFELITGRIENINSIIKNFFTTTSRDATR